LARRRARRPGKRDGRWRWRRPSTSPTRSRGRSLTVLPKAHSARELEVLSLVARGITDAEVAENLYVSPRTVSRHLRGAYRKLGVKSRTAAVKKAGELGLI
jgi:DNA-binding CsgD family transcriptional regulator